MNAVSRPDAEIGEIIQLGLVSHQRGQLAAAQSAYEQVLAKQPKHFDALHLLGVIAAQTTNPALAAELIGKAIEIDPNSALAYSNRGSVLYELKRLDEAIASYDQAIALKPDYAEAFYGRANALQELERLDEALASYDRAITLKPDYAEAFNNRGHALQALKRLEEALASFDRAIALRPDYAEAFNNRGNILLELKRLDEALASFDRAIALKQDYAEAFYNRGNAQQELKRLDDVLASYDQAIALKPDYAEAFYNRGNVLRQLNRLDDAVACFDKAIFLGPDYADAHWNKSLTLLLDGKFDEGWRLYEWRWTREELAGTKPQFAQPLWLGEQSLQSQTILLCCEQGLGDTLQFCRYVDLVAKRGARVILSVQAPLVPLLEKLDGVSQVIAEGQPLPDFDFHCPLLSLPLAFGTTLKTIPSPSAYLSVDEDKASSWQYRLGKKTKPRIGLAWSGRTTHKNDHNRSLTLESLLAYLPEGYQYICLQKELREIDRTALASNRHILFFGDELKDFTDTAALCALVDVVISVDTSVAHLAGALGKETWVLLPFAPDWRWLLDRDDSPWYESARLYRQSAPGDWEGALRKMRQDLVAKFSGPAEPGHNTHIEYIAEAQATSCPICNGKTALLDVVDFNKSCEEARGQYLPLSGKGVYYQRCDDCGFVNAPELSKWTPAAFLQHIYNADYLNVDPDYVEARPAANAALLQNFFPGNGDINHLDYGAGNSRLSQFLIDQGWRSTSYDPLGNEATRHPPKEKFDLITAFEVFEHHPNPDGLVQELRELADERFLILFSTLVSDDHLKPQSRMTWWYASPRNGHISLYSKKSLAHLAGKHDLMFGSFNDNLHVFFGRVLPPWARHLFVDNRT